MNVLSTLKKRFRPALAELVSDPTKLNELLALVRPAQDAKFGDYQANFAMPLGKQLGRPPREVATDIIAKSNLADLCQPPEIAGPGFINLRLQDEWLTEQLNRAVPDERLRASGLLKALDRSLPDGVAFFPWSELTEGEQRLLRTRAGQPGWHEPGFDPLNADSRPLHPASVGLRAAGEVCGWCLVREVRPGVAEYALLFVRKDLDRRHLGAVRRPWKHLS